MKTSYFFVGLKKWNVDVWVCVWGGGGVVLPLPASLFSSFTSKGEHMPCVMRNRVAGEISDQWDSGCVQKHVHFPSYRMSGSVDSTRIWHITQHIFRVVHSAEVSRIQPTVIWDWKLAKTTFVMHLVWPGLPRWVLLHSGFPSHRINLSPFTKDFRGGEQSNESLRRFFKPVSGGWNHETSDEENASQTKSIRWKRRLCDNNGRDDIDQNIIFH